jgi:hypothetical protein
MTCKRLWTAVLLVMLCASVPLAADPPGPMPEQETGNGPLAVLRSVVYFPFKGVVCTVGAVTSFPVYLASGLDPQVKSDTTALRGKYCSPDYLFGPEWPR